MDDERWTVEDCDYRPLDASLIADTPWLARLARQQKKHDCAGIGVCGGNLRMQRQPRWIGGSPGEAQAAKAVTRLRVLSIENEKSINVVHQR